MVESFENIVSTYAQQLSPNETQTFTMLSLTVVATLVSIVGLSHSMHGSAMHAWSLVALSRRKVSIF